MNGNIYNFKFIKKKKKPYISSNCSGRGCTTPGMHGGEIEVVEEVFNKCLVIKIKTTFYLGFILIILILNL